MLTLIRLIIIFIGFISTLSFATSHETFCGGESALLQLMDRPTAADSGCTVSSHQTLFETGYQFSYFERGQTGYIAPQLLMRLGFSNHTELGIFFPNEVKGNRAVLSGLAIRLRREIYYGQSFFYSIDGIATLPSGSAENGSAQFGGIFNQILTINLTDAVSLTGMLGFMSQSTSEKAGGKRFSSINPDIVLSWQPFTTWQFYIEGYGQTNSSPTQGPGVNADIGIQHLISKNIEIDFAIGGRKSGQLTDYYKFYNVGAGLLLD